MHFYTCPYIPKNLTYGCVLWGNNYEALLSQLARLQNKVVRIINNIPLRDHITPHDYINHYVSDWSMYNVYNYDIISSYKDALCIFLYVHTVYCTAHDRPQKTKC